MIHVGKQPPILSPDVFKEIEKLPEFLDDYQCQISLARALRYNLGFAWELFQETRMFPFQEIIINAWFKKTYSLFVASRGLGKSYLIGMFCILYAIFYPKSEIVIVSANFRAAKSVFKKIEDFIKGGKKNLLRSSFPKEVSRQADRYVLECINGSNIIGLPLSGEGLRGQRANVLIIDEGLLISKEVQQSVLKPFIVANLDLTNQNKIRELENQLVSEGLMGDHERTAFEKNKLIICSSASYQFEYLFEGIYQPNIDIILNRHSGLLADPSYFVCRSSYHVGLPHGIIDDSIIKDAETMGNADDPAIKREYWAEFTDSSGGYFNIKNLKECIFKDGETPTLKLFDKGKNNDFILAIDPSYASNKESDFFAMGLYQINYEEKKIILVNTYGRAGGDLIDHYEYLIYLLQNFNIVWVIIDATGTDGQFIKEFNTSAIAKEHNLQLNFMDVDFEVDDIDYREMLQRAKKEWNIHERRIVYKHVFGSGTNRKTNEYLASQISAKKVWFGSKINMHQSELKRFSEFKSKFKLRDRLGRDLEDTQEFIDVQDAWIDETIGQIALITIKPTDSGQNFRYDLPDYCKKSKEATRQRKDNYTTCLLATYGAKHIFDILNIQNIIPEDQFQVIAF